MIKKEIWFGLLLLVGAGLSPCWAQNIDEVKRDNNTGQQEQVKTIFSFKNELGISDEQELKLKALLYDEQTFLDESNNTLKVLGAELNKMIEQKQDMQAIKGKLQDIAKAQVEISYRNIDDSRQVETILTPDQLSKWRDIQKRFSASMPSK